ncbi:MAG: mechanosensitive ion channel [Deltaproteobacteria bacterium]|nr:mechanosensitive ion channel [Deltaproteobacteria bacterium]
MTSHDGKALPGVLFFITLLACVCLPASPAFPQAAVTSGIPSSESEGSAETTVQDLESLVQTIEDPNRRAVLLDQLRALVEAKKAGDKKETADRKTATEAEGAEFSEKVFARFEAYLTQIAASGRKTGELLSKAPSALQDVRRYLAAPERRQSLLRLLAVGVSAFIVSLLSRLLIFRRLPRPPSRDSFWPRRAAASVGSGVLRILPSGFALLALFLLFRVVPCPAMGRSIVFHLFIVLFGYRVVMETVRALLSPDEPGLRILWMGDESAYYYWVWMRRFADYTGLYFLVVGTLFLIQFPESPLLFIRGLLLLVYPGMITAFVLQVAKDLRTRPAEPEQGGESFRRRWAHIALRLFPALGVLYAWAFFLVLIASREKGFDFVSRATLGTAVTIPALIAALHLLGLLFDKLFDVHERIKERVPGIEERTDRHLAIVRRVSAGALVLIAVGVVAEFWGIPVSAFVVSRVGSTILIRAVTIAVTLSVVVMVLQLSRILALYLLRERDGRVVTQKTKTLVPMVRTAFNITAVFVGGIVILDRIGVDTTPILAGAGILGLAVGFGSQTLVKDLINGLFILFEESIRVGDWAQVGDKDGEVESVGLRTVRLRDLRGNVHVIPNSSIDTLTNFSKEFSRSVMDIGVAYREDIDEVIEILKELGEELRSDPEFGDRILGPLEVFGLDRFEDSAIIVRIRFNTRPMKQWGIKREYYRRMKRVFDERGIEIPFPHRTLYMGEPKEGPAPPVYVRVDKKAGKGGDRGGEQALPAPVQEEDQSSEQGE